jgi:type VI secretion system secreted protein VgrG
MPASLSTSNRMYFLSLQDYGEDDVLIEEMSGHEGMSRLFEFRLRLLSERDDVDPRRIIGKPAVLRIETWDARHMGGERHWNGIVSRFQRTGRTSSSDGHDLYSYECDIVPWFWFMTQHEDCRIFQNKTVREIVETIFEEFGYSDFRFELTDDHPSLEYCTQYHETTFDFISRLIEREGISYYFRHNEDDAESRHILVFTDNNASNPSLQPDTIPFHHEGHASDFDAIRTLSRDEQMRTRKVTIHGWNYTKKSVFSENTPTVLEIGVDRDLERYRYPGEIADTEIAKQWSKVAIESEEADHLRYRGNSQVRTLAPGHVFTLEHHLFDEYNIKYMVIEVWHHGRNNLTNDGGPSDYGNEFTLAPQETVFRAPLATPRGLVRGPQTALVVGPAGEEIYTDAQGRIKVRFHWDRKVQGRQTNMPDDRATCWIRVAQMWAGNGYGTMFIPRIGNEVVVDFLEGDPDQPIVIGSVYNGLNKPPIELPSHATRSTIKTLSSKGGGGFNELRFEDKKGQEQIFMHAQKDLQLRTGNCRTEAVGVHSNLSIGKNHTEVIGENRSATVAKNETVTIGQNRAFTVGINEVRTIGASMETTVGAMHVLTIGANYAVTVGANTMLSTGVGFHLNAGLDIVLQAGKTISLKAGPSSIVLGPDGVSVTGPIVRINSGGSPLSAKKPQEADKADLAPGAEQAIAAFAGAVSDPLQQVQAAALRTASLIAAAFCPQCEAARAALEALGD